LVAARHHEGDTGSHVYNLGTDETITVDDSLAIITAALGVTPAIEYTGGTRGWTGDSPRIHLDTTRIRSLGWKPGLSIGEAIARTVEWLDANMQVWSDVEFIQDPASTRGVNR
jgi:UDP-glucose 4-epimerase